ncbi:hypothetical protein HMPREF9130_0165 [Peptoniphilus sp. oral taxon 375 str. F0436]|nr:hypothetical protein HMPREF9130_0165 [Peptoniphilus sp. oral taxon 375 str. F0436]
MKKWTKVIILLLVLGGILAYLLWPKDHAKTTKLLWKKEINGEIQEARAMDQTIAVWDGDYLYLYDLKGQLLKKLDRSRENLKAQIGQSHIYLYRPGDKMLEILDKNGKTETIVTLKEDLFQVKEEDGQTIIHCKADNHEVLYLVKGKATDQIFKTDNFILQFDVHDKDNFAVSELSTSASGYKTRVYRKDSEMDKFDFPSEVGMGLYKGKKVTYLMTEKQLVKIHKDQISHIDIPLPSGVVFREKEVHILHSGIISSYNKKLEEKGKNILSMNAKDFFDNQGSLYATAEGEVAGNLTDKEVFYQPLGKEMDATHVYKDLVVSYQDQNLWVHQLVNQ